MYRNPRKNGLTNMTLDELWECIDCLKIDRSSIVGTGADIEIIWERPIRFIEYENIVTKKDLIKRIGKIVTGKSKFASSFHRISIGSYETSQILWIDCPEIKYQYTSLNKLSDGRYQVTSNSRDNIKFRDYTDIQCIWNTLEHNAKLEEMTRAIIFLETRELYVKLKYLFFDDMFSHNIGSYCDIFNYCTGLYCNLLGINKLSNIVVK